MAVTAYRFPISKGVGLNSFLGIPMRGRRKLFTSSDDVLIQQQPVTGTSLKRLAAILRTTQESIRYRARELGVSLMIGYQRKEAGDTRTFQRKGGLVDPLLERLRSVHKK
jgi:hypothetical protein